MVWIWKVGSLQFCHARPPAPSTGHGLDSVVPANRTGRVLHGGASGGGERRRPVSQGGASSGRLSEGGRYEPGDAGRYEARRVSPGRARAATEGGGLHVLAYERGGCRLQRVARRLRRLRRPSN